MLKLNSFIYHVSKRESIPTWYQVLYNRNKRPKKSQVQYNPPEQQQTSSNHNPSTSDKHRMHDPPPRRHRSQLGAVLIDRVPIEVSPSGIQVDISGAQPAAAFPQEAADPEDDDDGQGQVRLEEALHVVVTAADGADGNVELGEMKLVGVLNEKWVVKTREEVHT